MSIVNKKNLLSLLIIIFSITLIYLIFTIIEKSDRRPLEIEDPPVAFLT